VNIQPPEEYCEGIKILIARMETNPEDFELHGDARFLSLARTLEMGLRNPKEMEVYQDWNCLHRREQDALLNAYKEMGRRRFSQGIMQTLLEDELTPMEKQIRDAAALSSYPMGTKKTKKFLLNPAQVELMKSLTEKEKTQYLEGLKAWTES
jgi:hypothetical protein